MADLEPFIRGVAAEYLDVARDRDRFDLVQDFSLRLPLDVIGELIGIPPELRRTILELSTRSRARDPDPVNRGMPSEDAIAALIETKALYDGLVADRRKHPGDDVISTLIAAEVAEVAEDDATSTDSATISSRRSCSCWRPLATRP